MDPDDPARPAPDRRVAVVIVTRDRLRDLLRTLERLGALPEAPRTVVVDNASSDGTVGAIRERFPDVDVIALDENRGAAGRTAGVLCVEAPYVAFSDDDSWWAPGALARAADLLDSYPRLGLVAARVLVGPERRLDPACAEMVSSPLETAQDLPGPAVLGFIACGAVVRRSAYLRIGGFDARFGVGGEEELFAMDLAAAGWGLSYVDEVVAHHHPSPSRNPGRRRRIVIRNALWCAWLRRPLPSAVRRTLAVAWPALGDAAVRSGVVEALRSLPWVVRARRVVPPAVESSLRTLERRGAD